MWRRLYVGKAVAGAELRVAVFIKPAREAEEPTQQGTVRVDPAVARILRIIEHAGGLWAMVRPFQPGFSQARIQSMQGQWQQGEGGSFGLAGAAAVAAIRWAGEPGPASETQGGAVRIAKNVHHACTQAVHGSIVVRHAFTRKWGDKSQNPTIIMYMNFAAFQQESEVEGDRGEEDEPL